MPSTIQLLWPAAVQISEVQMEVSKHAEAAAAQVFFGDDTWTRLFPDTFSRAVPYPSFNLHDFHNTDRGVWAVRTPAW